MWSSGARPGGSGLEAALFVPAGDDGPVLFTGGRAGLHVGIGLDHVGEGQSGSAAANAAAAMVGGTAMTAKGPARGDPATRAGQPQDISALCRPLLATSSSRRRRRCGRYTLTQD